MTYNSKFADLAKCCNHAPLKKVLELLLREVPT